MAISVYDVTVPVFIRALKNTSAVLKKTEDWCKEHSVPESEMLAARLAPDMESLAFQIRFACALARNGVLSDSWAWVPWTAPLADENSFAGLQAGLLETVDALEKVAREDVEGREARAYEFWPRTGEEGVGVRFSFDDGNRLLQQFVLPNFWFQNTTAYAIARMKGVPLSKFDFILGGGPLG